MKKNSSFPALVFIVILAIGGAWAYAMHRATADVEALWIVAGTVLIALIFSSAIGRGSVE